MIKLAHSVAKIADILFCLWFPKFISVTFPFLSCLWPCLISPPLTSHLLPSSPTPTPQSVQTLRDSGVSLDTVRSAVAVKSGSPEFQGITLMMTSAVSSPRQATLLYFPGLLNMLMVLIEVN